MARSAAPIGSTGDRPAVRRRRTPGTRPTAGARWAQARSRPARRSGARTDRRPAATSRTSPPLPAGAELVRVATLVAMAALAISVLLPWLLDLAATTYR